MNNISWMKTKGAAEYLGLSPITLNIWRSKKKGPDYIKLGGGHIRYTKEQLDDFIQKSIVRPAR